METEIIYKVNKTDFKAAISETLSEINKAAVLNRFDGRLISVNAVAEIHNIHRDTVTRHARAGLIPSTIKGKRMVFNLADVLEMKF